MQKKSEENLSTLSVLSVDKILPHVSYKCEQWHVPFDANKNMSLERLLCRHIHNMLCEYVFTSEEARCFVLLFGVSYLYVLCWFAAFKVRAAPSLKAPFCL